ncbi:glycosyltransferase [Aliivibrio fischeri]|uniref:glycosyltransferase n=1 Tax=Aliivibrio fischeri TaxID=668 RepID=UPI0007C52E40|nr:glycosyltransferase family 4 protein [Aliivibrio fischeri]
MLFVHDHVFLKYKGSFYSQGKLTYLQLSYYFKYSNTIRVISRFKNVDYDPGDKYKSNGTNVTIIGVPGVLSKNGIFKRKEIISILTEEIFNSDFTIVRLPSELGLIANNICIENNKKCLVEMVASPFDCLWYRGDFFAKLYAPLLSFRTKLSLKKSNNVVYVTNKYLQQYYPSKGNSIGISDARISEINTIKKLNENKKIRIGVIGNPSLKLKGINTLFRLFEKLNENDFELSIVGGGGESELEYIMREVSNIELCGFISETKKLENWFSSLDIYIQPSLTEGLPRSVIEAMSFAIPVIGSNVGGIPEIVHQELLFTAGDVNDLNEKLDLLLNNKLYEKYSNHSVMTASKFNNSLDEIKDEYITRFLRE